MHALNLAIKRAHIRIVERGKKMLAELKVPGMTPARFDLMSALKGRSSRSSPGVPLRLALPAAQSSLRHALGVSRATVSKMITRLVEMGWLTRTPRTCPSTDRRTNDIQFTDEGRRVFFKATRRVFRERLWLAIYEELVPNTEVADDRHVLEAIHKIWLALYAFAQAFGDVSTLRYDFGHGYVPEDYEADPDKHDPRRWRKLNPPVKRPPEAAFDSYEYFRPDRNPELWEWRPSRRERYRLRGGDAPIVEDVPS